MKHILRAFTISLLCLMLVVGVCPVVHADDEQEILSIETVEDFLAFAEACRIDSYSVGLTVTLENDLKMDGVEFEAIPIFSGIFEGNNHYISGLSINYDGSYQGLFRYITEGAEVRNLTVDVDIAPEGSRSYVGGIAGSNAGSIINCRVRGSVSGNEYVGGIAGINTLTGVIRTCRANGTVSGLHFVGGIAGENNGVIRNSANAAMVNTTEVQNIVAMDDITLETITDTESAGTATDIGGIVGISTGVIRDCTNRGDVGYQLMGYNIGGIAGTQKGFIVGCENFGNIQGRKEVGGIVGQMEPVIYMDYSADTLQILSKHLESMSGITNTAAAHAQSGTAAMSSQINILSGQVGDAVVAVDKLLDDSGYDGGIPNPDTMDAIESTLAASMTDINVTLSHLGRAMENTMYTITGDLQALAGQINAMGETIEEATENIGISFVDVSDEDTADNHTGKVKNCINFGEVLADASAGGIAGAIAPENDMNGYEDIIYLGENSLNAENEYRAVIVNSDNKASVTAKKQYCGGIVGNGTMGLVRECVNTGTVDAEGADYVGGIAGFSGGFLRNCYVSCSIYGDVYVGGIAGSASIVSDCRSMVSMDATEKLGGILGYMDDSRTHSEDAEENEEEPSVRGNVYLSYDRDMGGIDGISYVDVAEPMEKEAFMALEELPTEFATITVQFIHEDGTVKSISLAPGGKLKESQLPNVPEKAGYTAHWAGLEDADLNQIMTDLTFEVEYTAKKPTIESAEARENGMPIFLAQGLFSGDQTIEISPSQIYPGLEYGEEVAEAWSFRFPHGGETEKLRFALPPGSSAAAVRVMIRNESGQWRDADITTEGSYVVFAIDEADEAICLINSPNIFLILALSAGAVVAVFLVIMLRKKLKRTQQAEYNSG